MFLIRGKFGNRMKWDTSTVRLPIQRKFLWCHINSVVMSRCLTCNCTTFEENLFKKDYCKHCLHDHTHKPATLYLFEQKKTETSASSTPISASSNVVVSSESKSDSNTSLKLSRKENERPKSLTSILVIFQFFSI
jgi:hypothetical protein